MNSIQDQVTTKLAEAASVLHVFSENPANIAFIETLAVTMADKLSRGNKIISFGNGGSMCDAMHFAEELTGKFRSERIALPAIAVSDPSHITCVANDFGFDSVFSRFVEGIGRPGDAVIALTTSGNSSNITKALEKAAEKGIDRFVLTGKDGGKARALADFAVIVPSDKSERIQEIHIKILHIAIDLCEGLLSQRGVIS